jgi:hypothetical protein
LCVVEDAPCALVTLHVWLAARSQVWAWAITAMNVATLIWLLATWRSVPEMAPDFINAAKPLEPNVMIALREPADARLQLGIRKRVVRFGLRVADPDGLVAELRP